LEINKTVIVASRWFLFYLTYIEKNFASIWSFTKKHNEMHGEQNIKRGISYLADDPLDSQERSCSM